MQHPFSELYLLPDLLEGLGGEGVGGQNERDKILMFMIYTFEEKRFIIIIILRICS